MVLQPDSLVTNTTRQVCKCGHKLNWCSVKCRSCQKLSTRTPRATPYAESTSPTNKNAPNGARKGCHCFEIWEAFALIFFDAWQPWKERPKTKKTTNEKRGKMNRLFQDFPLLRRRRQQLVLWLVQTPSSSFGKILRQKENDVSPLRRMGSILSSSLQSYWAILGLPRSINMSKKDRRRRRPKKK